jgi:hypothetical protein
MKILEAVKNLMDNKGISVCEACIVFKVEPSAVTRWTNKKEVLPNPKHSDKLSIHSGPYSILHNITQDLVDFVDEWHAKGLQVNRFNLIKKACQLKLKFSTKLEQAQKMSISCFMFRNNLTNYMAMHTAQRHPADVQGEALAYLNVIRPLLLDGTQDLDYILNMDQTPLYHAMYSKTTIHEKGAHTVNLHISAADSKRVTVAVTLTASERSLRPMVVFKGKFSFI